MGFYAVTITFIIILSKCEHKYWVGHGDWDPRHIIVLFRVNTPTDQLLLCPFDSQQNYTIKQKLH